MNIRFVARSTLIGAVLQTAMIVAGHYLPLVAQTFMWGGLLFSLVAGLVYVRMARGGWIDSLAGGLVAGALCAFIGLGFSVLLKDVPPSLLLFGTAGSALAGLIGAAVGKLIR